MLLLCHVLSPPQGFPHPAYQGIAAAPILNETRTPFFPTYAFVKSTYNTCRESQPVCRQCASEPSASQTRGT